MRINYSALGITGDEKQVDNYAFICCHLPSDTKHESKWKERDMISR